jgi:hypothetical protein
MPPVRSETIGSELPTRITSIEEETVLTDRNYALTLPAVPIYCSWEEGDRDLKQMKEQTDRTDPEISVAVAGVPASSPYTVLGEEGDSGSETDEGTDGRRIRSRNICSCRWWGAST